MIEIELDGQKVEVVEGSMVMQAADKVGTYIPHFCYHKKLTIAANCRMCLVDVEKAPKPMPACATPVTQGMVVRTKSPKALQAQKAMMEFLLINHPLDCPICDQGGECLLQDLAVGYGSSASRYTEDKRVVYPKDVGPLISMKEMNRCIHCTRCVRFGQEVAGVMELGMIHRGEHAEITTMLGETIDSELSGNMIDLCPVGALTSKPFRYSARTWELSRRKSVSPHDSVGTNLIVQVKSGKVMRVVPLENEAVNECWIADRDRYSYEALNSPDRLTAPQIKQGGVWRTVDWPTALDYVATGLKGISAEHGAEALGALGSAGSTVEELYLLAKVMRGLGSDNVDHRLRHADFSRAAGDGKARWLGTSIVSLTKLQRALVIGSFLRKDHPLFAARLRQAAIHGAHIHSLHAVHDDWLMPMASRSSVAPSGWEQALADIAAAIVEINGAEAPVAGTATDAAKTIAQSLMSGERKAILLGNTAQQHPRAEALLALAGWIGAQTGSSVGYLGEAANSVGAQLVGAMPQGGGLNAAAMLGGSALKACVLLNVEPVLDAADGVAARRALEGVEMVVAMTPFASAAADIADVMLPIAPFSETSGSFVNAEGRLQSFHGVVKPLADARPAWKVLRVLGNALGLAGFDFESSEAVLAEALGDPGTIVSRLGHEGAGPQPPTPASSSSSDGAGSGEVGPAIGADSCERIADVPIYATDALVRRAPALQATADARPPQVGVPEALWSRLGLVPGAAVRVMGEGGRGHVVLGARLDPTLAPNVIRIAAGHPDTAVLGAMFGRLTISQAPP